MKATIFDIKEFALGDGDGIRTTVFFKGCPLRCAWCHNPEGLSPAPELYIKRNGCKGCGLCRKGCSHPECEGLGRCLRICPSDLISVAGKAWGVDELREKLLLGKGILNSSGGGVTFSGGEPLMQADFLYEILKALRGELHRTIETSGFASEDIFKKIASECDFVIMDIKLISDEKHRQYTGRSNELILKNAAWLKESKIPHLFRTPLIPKITDTEENLKGIAEFIGDDKIELLSYNTLAPAKYASVGREYTLNVHENDITEPDISFFKNARLRK